MTSGERVYWDALMKAYDARAVQIIGDIVAKKKKPKKVKPKRKDY